MSKKPQHTAEIARSDKDMVMASLEPEQLATMKNSHIPRRRLSGLQISILWSLRLYLLFMIAVVLYQLWMGAR
jgi:hypothetical protein